MKRKSIILSILFLPFFSYCQVDNFDLLTKDIKKNGIISITKYFILNSKDKQKEYEIVFNNLGQIITLSEFKYTDRKKPPFVMKQSYVYDSTKIIAIIINAPDGTVAIDSLKYDTLGNLIIKNRYLNGRLIKTKNIKIKNHDANNKIFDKKGNLIKEIIDKETYIKFKYDKDGLLVKRIEFQDSKIDETEVFKYNDKKLICKSLIYLNYIKIDKKPLVYVYEYTFK